MRIIKRLYYFILKSFIPQLAMTFFIVLFIVLMQFLWKHIDDLVGKGLPFSVMGELFFYAALTMVPMALPLAILLASLMTFGNLGEKLELTAMKASGISLLQVMSPLIILVSAISVGAFFFQNDVMPKAQVKMYTLLFSMRQKSPELEIPEGVFYSQIPGYNIFVQKKNQDTGMMYGMMIYDVSHGGDNSTIILADSARLAFTKDMRYLYLHLFTGEQFENLREQSSLDRNVPFRRESFVDKEALIPFDANFNRLDEQGLRRQYVGLNYKELEVAIDSINHGLDSLGNIYGTSLRHEEVPFIRNIDSLKMARIEKVEETKKVPSFNLDSLVEALPAARRIDLYSRARSMVERQRDVYEFPALSLSDEKKSLRRHQIELIRKFTLSVACLVFFFIGAPLGAIIRKGGLGTPLVVSVLLFLLYYIIDNTGFKMARDGHVAAWFGMWLSTFILAPLGVFVTYKAINDSAVFDRDAYRQRLRHLLGLKEDRSIATKEVIMNEISRPQALGMLVTLSAEAKRMAASLSPLPGYRAYFEKGVDMKRLEEIDDRLEATVAYLLDSRDPQVVNKLSQYPLLRVLWIHHPASRRWLALVFEILFPVGVTLWLIGRRYLKSLRKEMQEISHVSDEIEELI